MQDHDPILLLLRFGSKDHLEELRRGRAHLNSVQFHQEREKTASFVDDWEGTSRLLLTRDGYDIELLSLDGTILVPRGSLMGSIRSSCTAFRLTNIYCFYAVRRSHVMEKGLFIEPRMRQFGGYWVAIMNMEALLQRFSMAANRLGMWLDHGPVEYFDETKFSGEVGVFKKRLRFSHESEYRFALQPGTGKPAFLELDDLSEIIAPVRAFDEFEASIRVEFKPIAE